MRSLDRLGEYVQQFRKDFTRSQIFFLSYLFEAALQVDPTDTHTLYQFAFFLYSIGDSKCEIYALRSAKSAPDHIPALVLYQSILKKFGWENELEDFKKRVNIK